MGYSFHHQPPADPLTPASQQTTDHTRHPTNAPQRHAQELWREMNTERLMTQAIRRPGPGWKEVGPDIWKHKSGVMIHLLGVANMPDGTPRWADPRLADWYIQLAGGNRKRGLMMWALTLHDIQVRAKKICDLIQPAPKGTREMNTDHGNHR